MLTFMGRGVVDGIAATAAGASGCIQRSCFVIAKNILNEIALLNLYDHKRRFKKEEKY
jgi:hypothetical protein